MTDTHRVVVPMSPKLVAAIDALAEQAQRSRAAQIRWMLLTMSAKVGLPSDDFPETHVVLDAEIAAASRPPKPSGHAFKAKSGTLRCTVCGVARGQHA